MASFLKVDVIIQELKKGIEGKYAEIVVRPNQKKGIKLDIRVIILGDENVGKSTLISVLMSGVLDNGKGELRMKVLQHKHEIMSGK